MNEEIKEWKMQSVKHKVAGCHRRAIGASADKPAGAAAGWCRRPTAGVRFPAPHQSLIIKTSEI